MHNESEPQSEAEFEPDPKIPPYALDTYTTSIEPLSRNYLLEQNTVKIDTRVLGKFYSGKDPLQAQYEIEEKLHHRLKVGDNVQLSGNVYWPVTQGAEFKVLELFPGGYLIGKDTEDRGKKIEVRIKVPISVLEIANNRRTLVETFEGGTRLSPEDLKKFKAQL